MVMYDSYHCDNKKTTGIKITLLLFTNFEIL